MISTTSIRSNLMLLQGLYVASVDVDETALFAKSALLDFCGWIEEAMDGIVLECANRVLTRPDHREFVEEIVKKNWGFDYVKHFRQMTISIIGLRGIETVEAGCDGGKLDVLVATLGSLKHPRNSHAHTHWVGALRTVDAPSVTIKNFTLVHDGLLDFETSLLSSGF